MVSTRSRNILHHGWLSSAKSAFTLGYYPYYVAIIKTGGNIEIRLISAVSLYVRSVPDGCSVEIVDASTEASIRRVEALDVSTVASQAITAGIVTGPIESPIRITDSVTAESATSAATAEIVSASATMNIRDDAAIDAPIKSSSTQITL